MQTSALPCDHNQPIATCKVCAPRAEALWHARASARPSETTVQPTVPTVQPIEPWDLRDARYRAEMPDSVAAPPFTSDP